jgi:cellulose synthase/poly-beta-1,6-N-acetylglucosamine synthase-like glycosyltransferase
VSAAETILFGLSVALFVYFALYNLATFALIAFSLVEASRSRLDRGANFSPPTRLRRPGISVIAPAYNMATIITASAHALLAADYDPLEVLIVDDGSSDGTTSALSAAFDLVELPVGDRMPIPTKPVTGLFVSRRDPRLLVLSKENGGRSDAINAGLNLARMELVATIDGDTLVEPDALTRVVADALTRVVEEFARDPDNTVAVGGTILIANGAAIDRGAVAQPRVSTAGFEATQTGEYLRSFLGTRIAWSKLNGLLIISGAFGVFRRDLLRTFGGLSKQTLGEDMEVVLRLHHLLRPRRPQTRISYAADATVWTEIPSSRSPLRTQRIRWHVGLLDNLRIHREMIGQRRYGQVGTLALPYSLLFEAVGPILQVIGYALIAATLVLDLASSWYAAAFVLLTLLAGGFQTTGAILAQEVALGRYRSRDLSLLIAWSLLELFWYQPLTAVWRSWATLLALIGRRPGWGTIPRGRALRVDPDADLVTAPLPR